MASGNRAIKLFWYDTDWVAATLALSRRSCVWGIRRRLDPATSLVLHLAAGWWAGFLVLVVVLRSAHDAAARRQLGGMPGHDRGPVLVLPPAGLRELARAALVCGFIGGIGFAAASMLKLVEVTSGYETNWHSILEQTTGLFNGIGLAVALVAPGESTPPQRPIEPDRPPDRTRGAWLRGAGDHLPQPA